MILQASKRNTNYEKEILYPNGVEESTRKYVINHLKYKKILYFPLIPNYYFMCNIVIL